MASVPGFVTPIIAALVPMRAGSERVSDKNTRLFAGRPLYHYILESLHSCKAISKIIIDTDIDKIIKEAPRLFERVQIIERPEHLRGGLISMNDVLLYDVQHVDADLYLQTHSTNPLLRAETISKAIDTFLHSEEHDSLFGVTRLFTRLWWANGEAVNHNPDVLLRTQDLPPVYEENSNIYIFTRDILQTRQNRIGYNPLMFEIDRAEAWDIDDLLDFDIAESLYRRRAISPGHK